MSNTKRTMYVFDPEGDITTLELVEFLRTLELTIDQKLYEQLSDSRRHFKENHHE